MYKIITEKSKLQKANVLLLRILKKGCRENFSREVGFRSGQASIMLRWNEKNSFWHGEKKQQNHYWICFGDTYPEDDKKFNIIVEINTPRAPSHGRAGLFLEDDKGRIYIAHTGRVGGGREGVNKTNFISYYLKRDGRVTNIAKNRKVVVLGELNDTLPKKIASYVKMVRQFKDDAANKAIKTQPSRKEDLNQRKLFKGKRLKLKFSGTLKIKNKKYREIEIIHDSIIGDFCKKIPSIDLWYDQERDLFIKNNKEAMKILYEFKTDTSTSSLYSAIGQLIIHGWKQKPRPKLIMVLPGMPKDQTTKQALKELKIHVLPYKWDGRVAVFDKKILPSCLP